MYLEVNYFFTWLASIMAVLMYFYLVKFRSPFNPEHLSGDGFIENSKGQKEAFFWTDKNSDDFLKYIKREIFEVAYLLASTIMTIEVLQYGHQWTEEKKCLPFVQKTICLLMVIERIVAILLKLRYLHQYLSYSKEQRHSQKMLQFFSKCLLNAIVLCFWVYDCVM